MRIYFCLVGLCVAFLQCECAFASSIVILDVSDRSQKHANPVVLDTSDYSAPWHSPVGPQKALSDSERSEPLVLRLRKNGTVASSNPVWNVCVSGKPVSKGLIMRNRDVSHHRRGHMHKDIPFSCRDYHKGDVAVWQHPDFPGLELTLDATGHLLSGLPVGYVAVKGQQS